MDAQDLLPLVEDLSSNIDDLEDSLTPLLKTALSQSTSKLPLLDKAKLYVLVAYAIESVLFSYLRLNGVDAKSHPVFQELARVKEYFGKIKAAETAGTKRSTILDKDAASRFIKDGLAGNKKYDRDRQERIAREKAGAKRKFDDIQVGTHTRFDTASKKMKASEEAEKSVDGSDDDEEDIDQDVAGIPAASSANAMQGPSTTYKESKAEKKAAKRQRRLEKRLAMGKSSSTGDADMEEIPRPSTSQVDVLEGDSSEVTSTTEALEALLQTSTADERSHTPRKKRKKRKSKSQKLEDERADEMK